jgi:hypothetical protein
MWSGEESYEQPQRVQGTLPTEVTSTQESAAPDPDAPREEIAVEQLVSDDAGPVGEWLEEVDPEGQEVDSVSPAPGASGQFVGAATVRRALIGATYPATRKRLIEAAKAAGASEEVLDLLSRLPTRRYRDRPAVLDALKEIE